METGLLDGIKRELLSEDAIQAAIDAAHRVIREQAEQPTADPARIEELRTEIENLTDAIASGALKSSPALADRLVRAEREIEALETQAARPAVQAMQMIPRIAHEYRAWIDDLETVLSPEGVTQGRTTDRDIARARAQLKKRPGGQIVVRGADTEIRFETEARPEEIALRLAASGPRDDW